MHWKVRSTLIEHDFAWLQIFIGGNYDDVDNNSDDNNNDEEGSVIIEYGSEENHDEWIVDGKYINLHNTEV